MPMPECRHEADGHFVMHRDDQAAAEDMGEITAVVHSHPDVPARPTEADLVQCEASEQPWVIVSVMPGDTDPGSPRTRVVEPSGYEAPLRGPDVESRRTRLLGLCRDWYRAENGA